MTSPPVHLLDLPSEILTSIHELCVEGIEARVEQPPKRFIEKRRSVLSRRYTNLDGGHRHRFVFKDADGTEVSLELLGVCRRMRDGSIPALAGAMPLILAISSYAPSITTPPEDIVPAGWTESVRELKVQRFIGSTAALPELLSRFKSLRRATIVWSLTHRMNVRTRPWLRTSYGHHASYKFWATDTRLHASLRDELAETFGKLLGSFAQSDRAYRLTISLGVGTFAIADGSPMPHRYTAIIAIAEEHADGSVKFRLEQTPEFKKLVAGEITATWFSWC